MKIGIDCRTILQEKGSERAGVAHYSYYLVKHILQIDKDNTYILFFSHGQGVSEEFVASNVEVVHFSKKIMPFFHSHYSIAKEIKKQNLDIFHSLSGTLPLFYRGKTVITIADLAMYVNPEWFSPKKFFGDFFWRKILIPRSIKKADTIIAISENTKKDILRFFHVDERKIAVIYLGVEIEEIDGKRAREILEKFHLVGKKYFLFIGTLEPRKNIVSVVRAFEKFCNRTDRSNRSNRLDTIDYYLVFAGGLGWKYEPILDAIINSGVSKYINYIGYVSAEEKSALLKNTQCFIWPSWYEGFGLPILEAMACGTPVITSNVSSIPEVAGNAAIMVDPYDSHAISEALARVSEDESEQKTLRLLAVERARNFSWDTTAQKTIDRYRKFTIEGGTEKQREG